MIVFGFDQNGLQMVAEAAVDAQNRVMRLEYQYQADRKIWQRSGAAGDRRGRPESEIAAGADGTLVIHNSSGATAETVEVTNPYGVTLPVELFCRVEKVKGWSKPFAVPDWFATCDELAPDLVAPVIGS